MVTAIVRFRVKLGAADQVVRLTELELVPVIRATPGVITYQAVVLGPQAVMFVSTYHDRPAAETANRAAASWVEERLASITEGPGRMAIGEVKIFVNLPHGATAAAPA